MDDFIDLKKLAIEAEELEKNLLDIFIGVPVLVDNTLSGYQYRVLVSPEIYKKLKALEINKKGKIV